MLGGDLGMRLPLAVREEKLQVGVQMELTEQV